MLAVRTVKGKPHKAWHAKVRLFKGGNQHAPHFRPCSGNLANQKGNKENNSA
jgi:hypothetical protein